MIPQPWLVLPSSGYAANHLLVVHRVLNRWQESSFLKQSAFHWISFRWYSNPITTRHSLHPNTPNSLLLVSVIFLLFVRGSLKTFSVINSLKLVLLYFYYESGHQDYYVHSLVRPVSFSEWTPAFLNASFASVQKFETPKAPSFIYGTFLYIKHHCRPVHIPYKK